MSRLPQVLHADQKPEKTHEHRMSEGEAVQMQLLPQQLLLQNGSEKPHAPRPRFHH